jgi:putative hydrolase
MGPARAELMGRIQAVMSLVEGHAEHVMDAAGAPVLPDLDELRAALVRRREAASGFSPWRIFERLLGLELKMRQYEDGRRFCDAVVAQSDVATLHRAWDSPEQLPSPAELADPAAWLARVAQAPA